VLQQQNLKEKWFKRKLERLNMARKEDEETFKLEALELQKYTITPFTGE